MAVTIAQVAEAIRAPKETKDWSPRVAVWNDLYSAASVTITLTLTDGQHTRTRRTLEMAKRGCEDWASLIWVEGAEVTADGDAEAALFESIFDDDFHRRFIAHIERTFGLGTGALEVNLDGLRITDSGNVEASADTRIYVDTVDCDALIPLTWSRGVITEAAFATIGETEVTVREHRDAPGGRAIINRRFTVSGSQLFETEVADGIAPVLLLLGAPRMFAAWAPAKANHLEPRSPFGVPVLSGAESACEVVDMAFDNMAQDIHLGGKMVFVPETMLRRDDNGNLIPPQRERRDLFIALDDAIGEGGKLHEHNPDLRVEDNERAIGTALSLLGEKLGFGAERYRYREGGVETATQVMSESSAMFRNRRKHLANITAALVAIGGAVLWCARNLANVPVDPDAEVIVRSDDSIIEDDGTRIARGLSLYQAGAISQYRFLTEYYGLSDEDARAEVEASTASAPPLFGE